MQSQPYCTIPCRIRPHASSHRGLRGKTVEETEIHTRNAVLPLFFSLSELGPESVKLHVDYSSVLVVFGSWEAGGGGERPVTGRTQVLVAAEK